jgi:hypothetical protein
MLSARNGPKFVGARLHEESQLLQTLRECKGLPSMQRAYVQFWEKALSQYEEETQRLLRITNGVMEEAAHIAHERIEATNGNADGSGPLEARHRRRGSALLS